MKKHIIISDIKQAIADYCLIVLIYLIVHYWDHIVVVYHSIITFITHIGVCIS